MTDDSRQVRSLNRRMLGKLVMAALLMFGFGYALVPMYKTICEVTGINVLTQKDGDVQAVANTQVDRSRTVTVEFDANARGPWTFRPAVSSVRVHPGEMTQVVYEVTNMRPHAVQVQAIPSYAPEQAAAHFRKLECFCFKQQTLGPNESRSMPVVFYLDRKLAPSVQTVTLSYTLFEVGAATADAR